MLLAAVVAHLPFSDWELFGLFLVISGVTSLLLGTVGLAIAERRRAGFGVILAARQALGVLVLVINVGLTALLMFISSHDLSLLGLLLFFAAGLSIYFGAVHGRTLSREVTTLTEATRRMAAGQPWQPVQIRGEGEIAELGAAFNRMAARLAENEARQRDLERARRELIAAVSHDLRTPLASIQATVEALCDRVVSDEETIDRYHQTIRTEAGRLRGLIDDLFELSRIDAGALQLSREPASLHDLISDTLLSMAPRATQKQLTLNGAVPPDLPPAWMDTARIQRVLVNLVDNAIRHTPAGGQITLTAADAGELVQVDVADTGEGVADADRQAAFEPFYRGEKSRARDGAGAGLGLAIARGLVEAHGGRIWIQATSRQGSVFTFTLPKARARG